MRIFLANTYSCRRSHIEGTCKVQQAFSRANRVRAAVMLRARTVRPPRVHACGAVAERLLLGPLVYSQGAMWSEHRLTRAAQPWVDNALCIPPRPLPRASSGEALPFRGRHRARLGEGERCDEAGSLEVGPQSPPAGLWPASGDQACWLAIPMYSPIRCSKLRR